MRNRGDDVGRVLVAHEREGAEPPPSLPRHFQDFMKLVSLLVHLSRADCLNYNNYFICYQMNKW